ncbi:MAG: hypothetical protein IIY87_02270 [Bacteroidales bacterium]|nr:hypothetical protein [Bacteroidales bacterium]
MRKYYLFLIASCFLLFSSVTFAQSSIEQGDEAFRYGYYKTAVEHYLDAYRKGQTPELAYKIAESYRLSSNYRDAIRYYRIVAESPKAMSFPNCEYFLASMYRNDGKADTALIYYQRYLRAAVNEELKSRARQESLSCQWVLDSSRSAHRDVGNEYTITHEGKNINTEYSESGAVMMGDSLLLFSSMREMSKPGSKDAINTDLVLMQVYQSKLAGGELSAAVLNQWGLNSKEKHTCNVALDPIHKNIYFTLCQNDDFSEIPCDIYVSHFARGRWLKAKKLAGDVNIDGYSSTHPTVGYLPDSSTILYFSSNRPGGMGGYDIWYTIIQEGKTPTKCVNLGAPVNTPGNEITPYYDWHSGSALVLEGNENTSGNLYFSSDWHLGFGGYDVFCSAGNRDSWQEPFNLGKPLNSPANDLYFTVNNSGSAHGDVGNSSDQSGYLTSNRRGSYFISDNTCCNDIYSWHGSSHSSSLRPAESKPTEATPPEKKDPLTIAIAQKGAVHHLLPIKLYFHNDEPDPKSKLATTTTTYFQTYNRYMFMRGDYKRAHTIANGNVVFDSICDAIDYFFDYDVQYNCERFEQFLNLMLDDLKAGHRISMTVEGYASPIHTSEYNQLISKRRIASIVNQIMEYKKGILTRYMGTGGGSLQIREVAYGSSHAQKGVSADRDKTNKSVYSVEAARERRIEIQDYQYLEDDSSLISCLHLPTRAMHIGTYFTGEYADIEIHLKHEAITETTLDFISLGSRDAQVVGYSKLTPGRDLVIYIRMDNRRAEPAVSAFLPITLRVRGEQITQTMFVEYQLER